jgi:glycosyltransferase involved in cell wall biosynthesis
MATVSIIIPAYNAAPFIGETLQSVFAQTFTDYEVLLINDGSPDTEALELAIAPIRDRINYIKQENRGASAARNAGLKEAQGEFVAFLDADDVWLPEYLEEQIAFTRSHDVNLICADAIVFDEEGVDSESYMNALTKDRSETGLVTFDGLIRGGQNLITSGVVARRKSVVAAGLFDESLRNAQDFDLWIRMTLLGARLAFQRKALLRYRDREGSLSGDATNRINRELRVYRKILAEYDITREQQLDVESAIRRCDRELHLVQGKEHLNRREFPQALESFRKARAIQSNWKLRLSCLLLAIAPNVLVKLNSLLNERRSHRATVLRNAP